MNSKNPNVVLLKVETPPDSGLPVKQTTLSERASIKNGSNSHANGGTYKGDKTEALGDTPFESNTVTEPKDKYQIVRVSMYFFGITSLLPWNFFIQANEYWMYKFRDINASNISAGNKTELQIAFSSYLSIASKVPYVIFLLVNATLSSRFLPDKRIQYPLIVMAALFIVTTVMVVVDTDNKQNIFFAVTISIVVAINAMCGFAQGGCTGIAGSLPKRYMGYNVNGMAVGGILASVAQIFSLLGDSSPTTSACIYFILATLTLCITYGLFLMTRKSEFYKFYMSKQASMDKDKSKAAFTKSKMTKIFKKVWVYALSVTVIFWVTISVLPAVMVLISSVSTEKTLWTTRFFIPVACFLVFNISDLIGRLVALRMTIPPSWKYLTLGLSLLRIIFVPLLLFCNATPRSHLPVIFDSDASFITIVVFFGLTNGYLTTIILTQAPKEVDVEHQELAGSFMAFFLGLGLMLGSVSSYGTINLI